MATADKTSIRHEVNRLKQEFEQLCAAGNVSAEIRVVMSSPPSSQTEKDETAKTDSKAKKGRGKEVLVYHPFCKFI